ncbi:MAG: peptidylprolyl isomerase [Ignavibacteriae bacterium]|nr:peptidylprolyl isomerase [Ignavibacteriota bacterium]
MKQALRLTSLFILLLFLIVSVNAQKKTTKKSITSNTKKIENIETEILSTVGIEKITYNDLERAYQKNMSRKEMNLYNVSKDSILDFLNLYVNYRLKVNDALSRGFDKDSGVLSEISQNRKILAESYFYEAKLVKPKVEEMLKQRDYEYQIAIIMFQLPSTPNPDTADTYQKALRSLNLLKSGANFEQVAKDSSSDKETAGRGGLVLNYITAGRVIRSIEEALFRLNVGQFWPELIRTKYGYFIIKLVKKESRVKILLHHILITTKDRGDSAANKRADSLLALLKSGADFEKLAKENSDDEKTAQKGGLLGDYYSRSSGFEDTQRNLLPEIEAASFSLKDGEFSGKVRSEYGIHIIKRDSTKKFDSEKDKAELKLQYKRQYFETDKKFYLDSLRNTLGFKLNETNINNLISYLDTNKTNLDTAWTKKIPQNIYPEILYSFQGKSTTIGEFIDMLQKKSELRGLGTNYSGLNKAIDKITSPLVFDAASKSLETEFTDYAQLLKEFRDGILLFKVEDIEVWSKLKFDSTLAHTYWDSTRTRYNTEPTYDLSEIYVLSDSSAKAIYKEITESDKVFDTLAAQNTQRAGYREKKGKWGKVTPKNNKLAKIASDKNAQPGMIIEPQPYEKGFSIIKVNTFEPVRQKTFEEAIPDFAPAFQDQIQKKLASAWLNNLKEKFNVKIYPDKIDQIIRQFKSK